MVLWNILFEPSVIYDMLNTSFFQIWITRYRNLVEYAILKYSFQTQESLIGD